MIEKMYTTKQIADILHISADAVRDRIQSKKLTSIKDGRQHLVKESTLEAYLKAKLDKVV